MELYWIVYNSKATHVRYVWKIDIFFVDLEFKEFNGFNKNQRQKKVWLIKSPFFSIFDMGCFSVMKNSLQFH
jgi:hypothetical protein